MKIVELWLKINNLLCVELKVISSVTPKVC